MNYELQDLWNLWDHDILKWERKLFSVLSKPLDAKVKKKKINNQILWFSRNILDPVLDINEFLW